MLSVLGDDRSGLVEALARVVSAHGGNWERSHMTQLVGKFAGLVLVSIPPDAVDGFLQDLEPLEREGLFDVTAEEASGGVSDRSGVLVELDLVGNDHPGIVHEVAHLLAELGVSFEDLETWTSDAPMAGGRLFHARSVLALPEDLEVGRLIGQMESLAADLMVDMTVIEDVAVDALRPGQV